MTIEEAIKHAEEVMVENLEKTKGRNASDPIAINCFECAEEHRQLAEWLKELKQLREQTRWIPVSEELPDKEGYYLCSVRYMYPPYNFFEPEKVKYMDDVTIQKFDGEFNIEVKAWMPLPPAPYELQESERV